jgi:transcriptional regulator with XRE-family HTH domain
MDLVSPVKGEILPGRSVRTDEAFGNRLKEAMARRGISPGRMAHDLEVAAQTVSRWRRGECPDDLRLPEIATYLKVSLEWLRKGLGDIEPRVQALGGDTTAQRAPAPGRRREDIELRAMAIHHAAGRLDVIARLIQAYRDAGTSPGPGTLDEWLDILASDPVNGPTPSGPGAPAAPQSARPPPPADDPGRP